MSHFVSSIAGKVIAPTRNGSLAEGGWIEPKVNCCLLLKIIPLPDLWLIFPSSNQGELFRVPFVSTQQQTTPLNCDSHLVDGGHFVQTPADVEEDTSIPEPWIDFTALF
jgi:hypothetical protein